MKSGFPSDKSTEFVVHPKIFSRTPNLRAGMSTKLGGEFESEFSMNMSFRVGDNPSVVKQNRAKFLSHLGLDEEQLAIPQQCHSTNVLNIHAPGTYEACDALITDEERIALVVTIADCVPILLFDPVKKIVGAVHTGWRGTAGHIVEKAIAIMKQEFSSNPKDIRAFIGPSAGVCCYEVGEEVAVMFGNKIVPYSNEKIFLDLKKENLLQLQKQGVLEEQIEVHASCTICEKDVFHSFRRDGTKAGRMLAVICLMN